ncbi:Thymidylate synthase [Vibrio cholerae]|nr:Thymidylate synthase [Vibrio cholerae]
MLLHESYLNLLGCLDSSHKLTSTREKSIHKGKELVETINANATININSIPVMYSNNEPLLDLNYAASRLVFFLSGSYLERHINNASPGVSFFAENGKISGSNYGSRILGMNPRQSPIQDIISLIRSRGMTKRATLSIHDNNDLRHHKSKDYPCCSSITFIPRAGKLSMHVSMRANNLLKLFQYNIFEFSFLNKIIASNLSMESEFLFYNCVSLHADSDQVKEYKLSTNLETRYFSFNENEGISEIQQKCFDFLCYLQFSYLDGEKKILDKIDDIAKGNKLLILLFYCYYYKVLVVKNMHTSSSVISKVNEFNEAFQ